MKRPTLCTHDAPFDPESFSREDLIHRFALWAASRGAQVRMRAGGIQEFVPALDKLQPEIAKRLVRAKSQTAFDTAHTEICRQLVQALPPIAFGRAAKFLNLYLKVVLVIADPEAPPVAWCHPPIDSRMLTALLFQGVAVPRGCQRWSRMDETAYVALITALRNDPRIQGHPLWKWEALWCPID